MTESVFHKTIKPSATEEFVDYYLFRRLAAYLVPVFSRLKIKPNAVTSIGLCIGFVSAGFFLKGLFFYGTLLLLLTVIVDCVDGMLARYTGQSSPIGRIWDGVADTMWTTAVWLCIFFSHRLDGIWGATPVLWLMIAAAVSMHLHCGTFDAVKNKYLSLVNPAFEETKQTVAEIRQQRKKAFAEKRFFEGVLFAIMAEHQAIFGEKVKVKRDIDPEKARKLLEGPMRLWTFCGEGTHHAVMIFFGLFTFIREEQIVPTFFVIAIAINIVWVISIFWWKKRMALVDALAA